MSSTTSSPGAKIQQAVTDKLPHLPETKEELKAEIKAEAKAAASAGASQLRSFVAGGFGGVCAVVVGHPFDLAKVRLQTAEKGVYTGAIDVVKKSIAKDGLRRGLYAGVSAPLVGVTPMCMSTHHLSIFTLPPFSLSPPNTPLLTFLPPKSSRCLLLGLRSRQANRPGHLHRRARRQPLHCPNLRRRLLLRHPHDRHHRPL